MGMVSEKKREFVDIIRWAESNIPPLVEPTCLSCGHGQPPLPGVPCRCTRYICGTSSGALWCFDGQQGTPSRGARLHF